MGRPAAKMLSQWAHSCRTSPQHLIKQLKCEQLLTQPALGRSCLSLTCIHLLVASQTDSMSLKVSCGTSFYRVDEDGHVLCRASTWRTEALERCGRHVLDEGSAISPAAVLNTVQHPDIGWSLPALSIPGISTAQRSRSPSSKPQSSFLPVSNARLSAASGRDVDNGGNGSLAWNMRCAAGLALGASVAMADLVGQVGGECSERAAAIAGAWDLHVAVCDGLIGKQSSLWSLLGLLPGLPTCDCVL